MMSREHEQVKKIDVNVFGYMFWAKQRVLLYPPYPKDRGMLWFYVEAARRPQWC